MNPQQQKEDLITVNIRKIREIESELTSRHAELLNKDLNEMDKKRIQHQINLLLAQKRTYSRENNKLEKQIAEWVCVSADTKNVYEEDGGSGKEFTTVVVCGNAAGVVLPPYTIYAAKAVNPLWCQHGPSQAQYVCRQMLYRT